MFRRRSSLVLLLTMLAMLLQSATHHVMDDHEEAATCDYCLLVEQAQPIDRDIVAVNVFAHVKHAVFQYQGQVDYLAFAKAHPSQEQPSIRPPPFYI